MATTTQILLQFVAGLKNRNEEVRNKTVNELHHFVSTELREMPGEEHTSFMDEFNHHIFEMVSSSDLNERKGGILAIATLSGVDVGNTSTRVTRFTNYLRNLLPSNDVSVMEMAAMAIGNLALLSGTHAAEYVEFEVKRALEWLSEERNEGKRMAAVLVLKELAVNTPTFFFQQVQQFFDCIFDAIRDLKPSVREAAVSALQAALTVTSQRETKETQRSQWYKQCFDESQKVADDIMLRERKMTRDDWMHGSLLIINELLRCSNVEGERLRVEMEEITNQQNIHETSLRELYGSKSKSHHHHGSFHHMQNKSKALLMTIRTGTTGYRNLPSRTNLFESKTCKMLINNNYDKVCNLVLRHRGSKSGFIQTTMLMVLPRLASFNPTVFSRIYLVDTINFLLVILKRDKDRTQAFQAIGLLAISVQEEIFRLLPRIMEIIRASLPPKDISSKKYRNFVVDPAVFTCISMLAKAVGANMTRDIRDLLDSMLATGLSPALTAALRDIAIQIPQLKKEIQDGLLKSLSLILMGRSLKHPGAPKTPASPLPPTASGGGLTESHDVTGITLALRTLGSFDFEGHSLTQFVRHCADQYLSSEHKEVRLEAVQTCAGLLTPLLALLSTNQEQVSMAAMTTVADVLNKLLVVGITDSDPDIRLCVLDSLDERFDPHLAQAENVSALFVALNDEAFEIRERAICMIGRLSSKNPAYVMPSLRKVLIQILTELEYSGIGRNKEQAARLLGHLVANAARLIRPYMEPILKVLIPKLKNPDPNPNVTISVLTAIGEQALVSGTEMKKWMDELLPIILDMLQDSTSIQKREISLWTLGQLIETTGCVVVPYQKYPTLLEVLLNFLKTEQTPGIRREVIRVLGLIGALDPHKHKMNIGLISERESAISKSDNKNNGDNNQDLSTSEMLASMSATSTLEEFYPAITVANLMKILRDPSLSEHHTMVVQATTFIFKSLRIKCVPYIPQVIPSFLTVIRNAEPSFREYLYQQLGVIVSVVKQHIKHYLDDIFTIIKEFWTPNSTMQSTIIRLIEHIVGALGTEFRVYLPQIIPQILRVFMHDTSSERVVTAELLEALQLFGANLDDYLHLLLPPVIKLFDSPEIPLAVRKLALETIDRLTDNLDLTDYASKLIHPLARILDSTPALHGTAMNTLCALVVQLGHKYMIFVPMMNKVLHRQRISHQRYSVLMTKLLRGTTISDEDIDLHSSKHRRNRSKANKISEATSSDTAAIKKLSVKFDHLQKALAAGRRVSKEDWMEWLRKLSIALLKESSSPALRSCWALAQTYNPLARDLFNAAFVSCWTELTECQQDELIDKLKQALNSQEITEITQTLLNLAEFMEHCDKGPLPLDSSLLGDRAMTCRAYAKALHYKEEQFHNNKDDKTEILDALISINNKLQHSEAAAGVLSYAKKHSNDLKVRENWYEKLHEWDHALKAYEEKEKLHPDDDTILLGKMRCLEALGQWGNLHTLACDKWSTANDKCRTKMARMASASAWGLGNWNSMEQYMCLIPRTSYDGAFYRAVFALHSDEFKQAQQCIDKARDILDTELTAMIGESYNRAYGAMVNVQMLAELEEIIQYKLVPERREAIRLNWWNRLKGCQQNVEDWQKILQVRSLVITPSEDRMTWLKYASLCRKNSRMALSHKTLVNLLGMDPSTDSTQPIPTAFPHVTFAYLKHMWKNNQRNDAYEKLQVFTSKSLQSKTVNLTLNEKVKLQAKCHRHLGDWAKDLLGIKEESIPQILEHYHLATQNDNNWYKAWHAWALMNYECVLFYKQKEQSLGKSGSTPMSADPGAISRPLMELVISPKPESNTAKIHKYCVPAVTAFFKSIALSSQNSLQDTLRLLTLWFDFGQWTEVYDALVEGIKTIEIDNWLQVIPQLIARIDTPRNLVGRLIHQLLIDIGKDHPQALIYPLTVAAKSNVTARQTAAEKILRSMSERNSTLVQQANLVSEELIRVAILWHELWHEGLEDASRLYFGERNIAGMFATLEPLHAMLDKGCHTLKETSFNQAYGHDLIQAQDWCKKYQRSGNVKDLTQAWDLYYHVFRRISKQLPQLTSLELQYVSRKLLQCQDLELAVPGTYQPNQAVVKIKRVKSSLQVITSKQRPRKLSIYGSDGKEYQFLLKGHEDLRQDERVMQLFGLVNSLLRNNQNTFRRNLTITRFSAIPLSTNSGLIGWVPHCDTLHSLIRDYREKKKILLNIEHRLMLRMAPDYDHLTLMQKVEVFEHALEHTQGDDLAKILWNKSPSSEVWFDRRTNYTRSLATMSMVGYVLGLGDRHPSNLMLDRMSGKIIHIDFGDCFEVAMVREKFPEKIPFRLTRMLINAMEVTGIEGNYQMTCQSVMEVLREHKDSLMAVLEAFVYDPLLNWRLVDATTKPKAKPNRSDSYAGSQEQGDLLESVDLSQSTSKKSVPDSVKTAGGDNVPLEVLNKKAIDIINRVRDKLTGRDFGGEEPMNVKNQVELLIKQATTHENLCQCYIGWCPFW